MSPKRIVAGLALLLFLLALSAYTVTPQALGTNPGIPGSTNFVLSFNGRQGVVVSTTGDYSFANLTGQATANQVPNLNLLNGQISLSQLPQAGATTGQALCWSGTWAPCTISGGGGGGGGGSPVFVDQITPTGTINGVNIYFAIPDVPSPTTSLQVWVNGILMCSSAVTCPSGTDYVISGNTFFFNTGSIPQTGDSVLASYRH